MRPTTPNTPSPLPVVILHSSCNEKEDDIPSSAKSNDKYGDTSIDDLGTALASLPFACDILILPEIPNIDNNDGRSKSGDFEEPVSTSDVVELVQASLNPCGMANVFLVENLAMAPFSSGEFLLSLTSCNILHDATDSFYLPVEPIPSTFAFSFEVSEEARPQQFTAELDVGFDLNPARNRLLKYMDFSGNNSLSSETQAIQETLEGTQSDNRQGADQSRKKTESQPRFDPYLADATDRRPLDASFLVDMCFQPPTQAQQRAPLTGSERDMFLRMQAIMQEEEEELSRILSFFAAVGVFLFILLLWATWQLFQDANELPVRKKERATLSSELSATSPFSECTEQTSEFSPVSVMTTLEVNETDVNARKPSVLPQVTPPREQRPMQSSGPVRTQPVAAKPPTSPPKINPTSRSHWAQHLLVPQVTPPRNGAISLTPPNAANMTQDNLPPIPVKQDDPEMSPCSKLAMAWSQRKKAPHKTRQIRKLQPAMNGTSYAKSDAKSPLSQSRDAGLISRLPTTNNPHAYHASQTSKPVSSRVDNDTCGDLGGRALHSLDSEVNVFLRPHSAPSLPELCSTPGSDDSFIEDYW